MYHHALHVPHQLPVQVVFPIITLNLALLHVQLVPMENILRVEQRHLAQVTSLFLITGLQNEIIGCPSTCSSCTSATTCTSCIANYYYSSTSATCTACNPGTFSAGGTVIQCTSNTLFYFEPYNLS